MKTYNLVKRKYEQANWLLRRVSTPPSWKSLASLGARSPQPVFVPPAWIFISVTNTELQSSWKAAWSPCHKGLMSQLSGDGGSEAKTARPLWNISFTSSVSVSSSHIYECNKLVLHGNGITFSDGSKYSGKEKEWIEIWWKRKLGKTFDSSGT